MNFTFIGWLVRPRCKICKQRVQVLLSNASGEMKAISKHIKMNICIWLSWEKAWAYWVILLS